MAEFRSRKIHVSEGEQELGALVHQRPRGSEVDRRTSLLPALRHVALSVVDVTQLELDRTGQLKLVVERHVPRVVRRGGQGERSRRREEQERLERVDIVLVPVHTAGHAPGFTDLVFQKNLHPSLCGVAGVLEYPINDVIVRVRVVDGKDTEERVFDVSVVEGRTDRSVLPGAAKA